MKFIYKLISPASFIVLSVILAVISFKVGLNLKTSYPEYSSFLINVSASFTVIAITTFFVDILIKQRSQNEWKKVKKLVGSDINRNIETFINSIENIFDIEPQRTTSPNPFKPGFYEDMEKWMKEEPILKSKNYKEKVKPSLTNKDLLISSDQNDKLYNAVEKLKNENLNTMQLFNISLEPIIFEKLILFNKQLEYMLAGLSIGKFYFKSKKTRKSFALNYMVPSSLDLLLEDLENLYEEVKKLNLDIYGKLNLKS